MRIEPALHGIMAIVLISTACSTGGHGTPDGDTGIDTGDADTSGDTAPDPDADAPADTAIDPDGPADSDADPDEDADDSDSSDVAPDDTAAEDPADVEPEPDPYLTDDDGDGFSEFDGDCDDTDDRIYPAAASHIEGIDYDCDSRREYLAKMQVAVDDAFDLCVNGIAVGSCGPPTTDTCFRDGMHFEMILESGLNSFGVNGWDLGGVTAAFGMWVEVAGREIPTRGNRPTEPGTAAWRYFPTSGDEPQASWCDQTFDGSDWGPAVFAEEVGDGAWLYQPTSLARLGATWLWDGNPTGLVDSWFRMEVLLPDEDPLSDPGDATACTAAPAVTVSDPASQLYNGVDVIWTGSAWMAVYDQWGRSWGGGVDDARTRMLAADGTPLSTAVMVNDTNATWWNTWPVAVWTGSTAGVFFEDGRSNRNTDIAYGRLVDSAGLPQGTADVRLDSTTSRQKHPDAAWSGSEFGVAWQDDRDGNFEVYFKRISSAMAAVGTAVRVTSSLGSSRLPTIAWSGSEWGLAWEDERDSGDLEIYFTRLSADGTLPGSDLRITSWAGASTSPSISWSGSEWAIAWQDDGWVNSEIGFLRISPDGVPIGSHVRVTSDSAVSATPDIVWTGTAYGIAWRDNRSGNADIWIAVLAPDGTKIAGDYQVDATDGWSLHPAIAWSGSTFGVTWMEEEDPSGTPYNPWYMDSMFVALTCP